MAGELYDAHREASDWFILLREEPDNAAARARFESWLDADPLHARAWVSVSETFDAIGETGAELEGVWRAAAGSTRAGRFRLSRPWSRKAGGRVRRPALAGAIAAAFVAAWFGPSALLSLRSDHMTAAGEIDTVRLADGSAVLLGPESAIAIDYTTSDRTVRLLAGQAWFDVKHDPAAPFRVIAGDVKTTVLGTKFDVRRIGGTTNISVGQGRVRVVDHGMAPANRRELTAGDWLRVDSDHDMEAGAGNPAMLGAWRDGRIVVRNRTVAEVIEELRPWYGGRILLLSSTLGRKRIDGVYNGHESHGAVVAAVRQAGGKVRRITPWLLVVS